MCDCGNQRVKRREASIGRMISAQVVVLRKADGELLHQNKTVVSDSIMVKNVH